MFAVGTALGIGFYLRIGLHKTAEGIFIALGRGVVMIPASSDIYQQPVVGGSALVPFYRQIIDLTQIQQYLGKGKVIKANCYNELRSSTRIITSFHRVPAGIEKLEQPSLLDLADREDLNCYWANTHR